MVEDLRSDFLETLRALSAGGVRFVVIGGIAMRLQGCAHLTDDIDVCYARDPQNIESVVNALAQHHPRLRIPGGEIPFHWDTRTLKNTINLTLTIDLGILDMHGEAAGVDSFEGLWERSTVMDVYGLQVHVASVDDLISMKRAANRLQDQIHILELLALKKILEEGGTQLK
jgi:predicted nucleotidyltransferase